MAILYNTPEPFKNVFALSKLYMNYIMCCRISIHEINFSHVLFQ